MQERPYWWRPEDHPGRGAWQPDWERAPEHRQAHDRESWRDDVHDYDDDDDDRDWADRASDEVKSWFGNERAEHRRDLDAHERQRRHREDERYRGVGPRDYHGEDDWLRDQVSARLADDPRLDASGIMVRVIDNEAILDGIVRNERDARRAYDIAEDVPGVVYVRERLSTDRRRRRRGRHY